MCTLKNNNGILEMPMELKYQPDSQGFGVHCFYKMKEFSEKIAQIEVATNKSDTYGKVLINSIRVALKMKSLGITDEHVTSLCTGTHIETCYPFWASMFLGAKTANLHTLLTISDMKHLVNLTKPKIIFSAPESVEKLEIVTNDLNLDTILVVFGETDKHIPFTEFLKPQSGEEDFQPKVAENLFDTVSILFSSGTTGLPKGICLTHYSVLYMAYVLREYFDFSSTICLSTPYWISYICMLPATLMYGGYFVLAKFDEKTLLKTIQDYKVSCILLMPSFTYAITSHPDNSNSNFDVSSLKSVAIAGGCIENDQVERMRKIFKCTVSRLYGATETNGVFSAFKNYETELVLNKPDSCGRMLSNLKCKVVDVSTNDIIGPNKSGELLIKSNLITSGYYNDPKKTAETFDEDGFFRTGDIVYYDKDYCFYIVERIKEMFKYQFWHIVPAPLEKILSKHPAVKEVLIIGYPDEVDSAHPMAVIVANDEVDVSEDDILHYFNNQVADYEKLRGGVKFVKSLPKTPTGKYSRKILRNLVINNEI